MKKRLLALVLALTMIIPAVMMPVEAISDRKYTYTIRIQTRKESYGGTDSDVYGGYGYHGEGVQRHYLDNKGNDFEQGDNDYYYGLVCKGDPWMIDRAHLHINGKDAWKPGNFEVFLPTVAKPADSQYVGTVYFGGTLEKGNTDTAEVSVAHLTRRNFSSIGSFDNWGTSIYLGSGDTGNLSLSWNGKTTDQYGTYNIFAYDDPATFSMSAQFNTGTSTLFTSALTKPNSSTSASYNLSYAAMYNEMVAKGIGKAILTFTLSIPARSSNAGSLFTTSGSNLVHTETVTIYRKCFDIGNVSYSETPVFTARKDNDFLNSEKRNVTITVSPTELHCSSSMTDSEIKTLVKNFTCNAALYSGNGTDVKLTDLTYAPSSDGKKIVFKGTVPADFTSNGAGVNLYLTNVSTKYNNVKYTLDSGSTTWNYYISTLKVDTDRPTVNITDKDGAPLQVANVLAPEHTFYLSGSELLYKSNTSPHPGEDEAYLRYSLLDGDTKVMINNYNGGTGSYLNVTVPVSTAVMQDLPITLKTAEAGEGTYTLMFEGWDDAGNPIADAAVENVLLDSAAPRYTLVDSKTYQDAQKIKHSEYNFALTDICNTYKNTLGSWSRLYYVFVPNGQSVPEFDQNDITGEIETTVGRWNFVEAEYDGSLPTVLLSLGLEESFKGDLYILTKDSVGNTTDVIKYSSDLEIYNYDTADTLETSSNIAPKKSFDISFKDSISGIDGVYSTEYRWVPVSVNATPLVQSYIKYDGQDVGAGVQYGDDGEPVVMDGTYRLEYKVTETRSGNTATFEKNYMFDNCAPVIDVAWDSDNDSPLQIQQATVIVSDVSGVAEATYKIFTADGEEVGGGTLTPTVGGDGKSGVRENVKLQPTENGVYKLVVYATDVNGDSTVNDSTENFAIRAKKPEIISAGDDIAVKLDGVSVTSSNDYDVYLQINENMICADQLVNEQTVKYQVSTDGINYGPWNTLDAIMDVSDDRLSLNCEINSPVVLSEGANTLYFKVACAQKGDTAEPALSLVSNVFPYNIIYDTTAPGYEVEYSTTVPTAEDVIVTVRTRDVNKVTSMSVANALITVDKISDLEYTLTVKRNVDTYVILSDAVDNEVNVPICVTNIDKDAPKVQAGIESFESGARSDVYVNVTVEDTNSVSTKFALVEDPDENSVIDDAAYELFNANSSKFSIIKTEEDGITEYALTLRGLDGVYGLAVVAEDILGNTEIIRPVDNAFTAVDAMGEIVSNVSDPEITKSTATVSIGFNVPLYVLPSALATGDSDEENENIAGNQSQKTYVMSLTRIVSDNSEQKIYAVDEANRTYTLTFASDARFIEGFKYISTLYKNGEEIQNGSFIAFTEDDTVQLVIEANPEYSFQSFDISEMVLNGYEFDAEASVAYEGENLGYSKLVFTALHDGKTEKNVSFTSYTAEGTVESERYQKESVYTSVFDETVPTAEFTPSVQNTQPTNSDVTVLAVFGDAESGIESVTRIVGSKQTELGAKVSDSVVFTENGSVKYVVTNKAGMKYTAKYTVSNIDKTPITEGEHYTVTYYYQNYLGKWTPIEDGKYYRLVKAVVKFVDSGKQLTVTNNGTLAETILTSEKNSFTFDIKDNAGNVASKTVSYSNYDNEGGTIEWSLSNYNKTNKPVTAFVTIADKDSVNEIVYAEVRDAAGELYLWNDEVLGNEYSVILPLSGNYTVKAYDAAGNEFTNQITVSNIDIVKPIITRLSYSTPKDTITTRSVLVKIEEFSKSGVTVTGIERSDSLGEYDIVYTPGATEIRFKKSGYVSVFFVDDYGNENAEVISVGNIYTEPPALEAVATLAADELSVEISFRKQYDENGMPVDKYRELKDLSVVYDGITYTTDKTFKIKQNGDYTFTIFDHSGTSQTISLTVSNIDDRAPVIKTVSWSYEYLEENGGVWEKKYFEKTLEIGKDTSGTEAGYTVGPDIYKTTNNDVTVTVVTDKDASILGSDDIKSKSNSLIYAENGLFTFNLAAVNGTVSSYGVDVAIIDKEAPTLNIAGANELIFIEGMTNARDPEFAYDKSKFYDFEAYDVFMGVRTELTDKVEIDFGDFNPDDISANVFDRTKPYTITYTVYDSTGNRTQIRRTVRLIGFYDTVALINGKMPNSANSIVVNGDEFEVGLKNFAGSAYVKLAKGIYTMGQMKTLGTPISPYNGKFIASGLSEGWYTVFVQTDKRDYFTITVYVDTVD